ncbi:MAG: hypothetical protein JWO64_1388, partial [Hyphomicrobiales bacterium]|nr:hypothetical protein [Hyphomicrobiales bacterium]
MLMRSLAIPHAGAHAGIDFPHVHDLAVEAPDARALVSLLKA